VPLRRCTGSIDAPCSRPCFESGESLRESRPVPRPIRPALIRPPHPVRTGAEAPSFRDRSKSAMLSPEICSRFWRSAVSLGVSVCVSATISASSRPSSSCTVALREMMLVAASRKRRICFAERFASPATSSAVGSRPNASRNRKVSHLDEALSGVFPTKKECQMAEVRSDYVAGAEECFFDFSRTSSCGVGSYS